MWPISQNTKFCQNGPHQYLSSDLSDHCPTECIRDTEQINEDPSYNYEETIIINLPLLNWNEYLMQVTTKHMWFSNSHEDVSDDLFISTLDGALVDRVPAYKYLGSWIDEKRSFKNHVDELVKKLII